MRATTTTTAAISPGVSAIYGGGFYGVSFVCYYESEQRNWVGQTDVYRGREADRRGNYGWEKSSVAEF